MKKRLLSMLLALTMVLSLVSAMGITASAETAQPYLTFLSQSEFQLGTYDDSCKNWTKNTGSYLEYTTTPENVESWMVWDGATAINSAKAGETYYLYLRGKMTTGSMSWFDEGDPNDPEDDGWCETNFDFRDATGKTIGDGEAAVTESQRVNCFGNIMTLLDYEHPDTVEMSTYAFLYLFYECHALGTAPTLPATTLAYGCYDDMFCGCTSLEEAPTLPATTLTEGCYECMFEDCISLTEAPKLPATELETYCYDEMFKGCTSLTEAPELPATTLAKGCYWGMFQNSGLTKAPELPVTALEDECYQSMFCGCESLTVAPELPATVMKDYCYGDMFNGCASLKVAPKLPSTTLAESCYASMFASCTSLVYAPDLPATELKPNCYAGMFADCTALTTPPCMAAATDLESHGSEPYQYMFQGCTSLVKYTSPAEGKAAFFTVPGNLEPDNNYFFNNYCQDMFGDGDNYDKNTVFYVGTVAAPVYEAPTGNMSLVYNGDEQALLSDTGKAETPACKLQYSLTKDGMYTDAVPTASAVGTYTVWYKAVSDGSTLYFDSEPASVSAHIGIITKVTSCTYSIALEKDDMDTQQAREIAKALLPISGLASASTTRLIYAVDNSGNYSYLAPASTQESSNWANQTTTLTFADILADLENNNYYVIGNIAEAPITKLTSGTCAIALEKDDTTHAQAREIANVLLPISGLTNASRTRLIYATEDGRYKISAPESNLTSMSWAAQTTRLTLAEILADLENHDYYVIGVPMAKLTSDTYSITLANDNMDHRQAREIANALLPISGLTSASKTRLIYAMEDGSYKFSTPESNLSSMSWTAQTTKLTLADILADHENDYYVIGSIAEAAVTKVTSNTYSITLENDNMDHRQAREIANALLPISGLTSASKTRLIYAMEDGSYKFSTPESNLSSMSWTAQTAKLTLADILADLESNDYYVIGTVTETAINGNDGEPITDPTAVNNAKTAINNIKTGIAAEKSFNGTGSGAAGSSTIVIVLGGNGYVEVILTGVSMNHAGAAAGSTSKVTTYTFDVIPHDSTGTVQHTLSGNITFRLPILVADAAAYAYADVYHNGVFLGQYAIGGRDYIEITAGNFSEYSYTLTNTSRYSGGIGTSSYAVTVSETKNGSVSVTPKNASAGSTVTITVTPDKGYTLETLTVLNASGKEIDLTAVKIGDTYNFKMPSSTVTLTATFMEDNTMLNYFVDVNASDYYYDAVLWAATNGITSGVDSLHFAPNTITTRGQMVTFLWRAAGCPEPTITACPFTDVKADAYYCTAVLWGYENGLIKGVSDTRFAPDAVVTRAQAVTFLWRYNGAIQFANMTATGPAPSPFADVATDAYYYNAVLWAKAEGITDGKTATMFAPNEDCLRGQIVTFLYRCFVK